MLTFADRSNRGWRWWTGLLSFGLICGSGAFANLKAAEIVFGEGWPWTAAAAAGAAVGAAWNYLVSARFTWRRG